MALNQYFYNHTSYYREGQAQICIYLYLGEIF